MGLQEIRILDIDQKRLVEQKVDHPSNILSCVRKWGGAASDAVLDPICSTFSRPNIDGLIGFRFVKGCAIVFGDPICSDADLPALVSAFHKYCDEQRKSIIYVTASKKFAEWAVPRICKAMVEFGEEFFLDPHSDPRKEKGVHASLVRRKVKRALQEHVIVCEYTGFDRPLEVEIENVGNLWLKNRQGPQIYISHVRLFDDLAGKRWFYARQNNKIVGVVVLNQLEAHDGWLLNHLMITPEASLGTPELLVISALEILAEEGCHYVTFGSVPNAQLGEIFGLGKFPTWMARHMFTLSSKYFHLEGRKKFWEKFLPKSRSSYLLFSRPHIGIKEVLAFSNAMNVSF